jgi:hypothetical protein
MSDAEFPNEITPRHFAVLAILREIGELDARIADNQRDVDPSDYFRSQIRVWLERAKEELQRAVVYLQDHADAGGDD